ncbi:MAG: hypothetical protein ACN0LA_11025 [Candidatus Longimicrobiales bacterium M2_2A_002]
MARLSGFLLVLIVPLLFACDDAPTTPPADDALQVQDVRQSMHSRGDAMANQQLAALRRATARYHDPAAAEAAGYHMEPECISAASLGAPAELGAMGYHFVNPPLIDGTVELEKPEVLVYEKREDGAMHLVAVEYLFVGEEAPELMGQHFHEFHPPFADFELHAWVWKGNPNGVFADFNPTVSCPTS